MNTIVVGVDGSATSLAALHWARREATLRGRQLRAVHGSSSLDGHRDAVANLERIVESALGADGDDVGREVAVGVAGLLGIAPTSHSVEA